MSELDKNLLEGIVEAPVETKVEVVELVSAEVPEAKVEKVEVVELVSAEAPVAKIEAASIPSLTLAAQVGALKGELMASAELVASKEKALQCVQAELAIEQDAVKSLRASLDIAEAKVTQFVSAQKGFEETITKLQSQVDEQKKVLSLKAYADASVVGTTPVKIENKEGMSIVEQYNSLKGDAQFKFYQANKTDILKALGKK